ncbi:MAG: hypothetical protein F2808_01065, partial [Actinobacteria bacterium]|nr:hypothetical protein [Actinomycetota bacterium]
MADLTTRVESDVASHGLTIFGVASSFVYDVVESAQRRGFATTCIDNLGTADRDLPNLELLSDTSDRRRPFTIGLGSAHHRGLALVASAEKGFRQPFSLVDPTAIVAHSTTFGHSAYVNAGVVVGPHTDIGCGASIN